MEKKNLYIKINFIAPVIKNYSYYEYPKLQKVSKLEL